jgi:hypothetical protein
MVGGEAVTIFDTYRVVLANADGSQVPLDLQSREGALEDFNLLLVVGADEPWQGQERIRVISEKVWIESQAATS